MNTAEKRKSELLPMPIDLGEFRRVLLKELAGPLEDVLSTKKDAGPVGQVVETVVLRTLGQISPNHRLYIMKPGKTGNRKFKEAPPVKVLDTLPVEDLKPSAVIDNGLVEMSLSQLYRATKDGRFYCSKPRGRSRGKLYPAWQFVHPVPDMLPEVLRVLAGQGEKYIHARMVTAEDELMELAPAEVLAGRLFNAGENLHSDQAELLTLQPSERLAIVKNVFGKPSREHQIG
jgi:hypothetical protein